MKVTKNYDFSCHNYIVYRLNIHETAEKKEKRGKKRKDKTHQTRGHCHLKNLPGFVVQVMTLDFPFLRAVIIIQLQAWKWCSFNQASKPMLRNQSIDNTRVNHGIRCLTRRGFLRLSMRRMPVIIFFCFNQSPGQENISNSVDVQYLPVLQEGNLVDILAEMSRGDVSSRYTSVCLSLGWCQNVRDTPAFFPGHSSSCSHFSLDQVFFLQETHR